MAHVQRKGIILIMCEICLPRWVTREDDRKDELIFSIRWLTILSFQSQTWKRLPCRPFKWMHVCIHTSSPRSVMVWHRMESDLGCLAKEQWANGDSLKENLILLQSFDLFVFKSTAHRLNRLVLLTFPGTISFWNWCIAYNKPNAIAPGHLNFSYFILVLCIYYLDGEFLHDVQTPVEHCAYSQCCVSNNSVSKVL